MEKHHRAFVISESQARSPPTACTASARVISLAEMFTDVFLEGRCHEGLDLRADVVLKETFRAEKGQVYSCELHSLRAP